MENDLWNYVANEYLYILRDTIEREGLRVNVSKAGLRDILNVDSLDLLAWVENFPNTWGAELLVSERERTRREREPDCLIDDGQGNALLIEWSVSPPGFLSRVRQDEVGPYDLIVLRPSSGIGIRVSLGVTSAVELVEAFVIGSSELWIVGHFDDPAEAYHVQFERD